MKCTIVRERIHRDAETCAASRKMSVRSDKFAGIVIVAQIFLEFRFAHSDLDVLANLQVEMRIVLAVRRPHRPDLLSARHLLTTLDQN